MTCRSVLVAFVSMLVAVSESFGDTPVGGAISSDTTWALTGSPYVASSTVTVNSGVTLTVEPGVTVKMAASCRLDVYGTLTAEGTPGAAVVFTSTQASPAPGNWQGIYFQATASASRLSHVTVSYAGATYYGGIVVNGSSPVFDHVTVSHSSTSGIRVVGSTATLTLSDSTLTANVQYGLAVIQGTGVELTNTALTNNGQYAAWVEPNTRVTGLTGLTVSGNGGGTKDGAWYTGGTITGSETWRPGWVWFVGSTISVGSSTNTAASLRVEAGVTAKMPWGARLDVYGTLTVAGTAEAAVLLTSAQAPPAPGNWQGIYFQATASASRLSHVTVSYAGATYYGGIVVNGSSPVFDHVTVSHSSTSGIRVVGSTATLTLRDSTLTANVQYGLAVIQGTGVELTNTALTNNGQYAAWVEPNTRVTGLTGLTVSGNGGGTKNGAWYTGGTITGSETWRPGWVWFVGSTISVGSSTNTAASLRVEAGATAKMPWGARLDVYGTLTVAGTAEAPVLLTSAQASPAPGNWQGIYLRSSASASRLSYMTVSYAGATSYGGIVVDGSSPVFDHVTVSYSSTTGIRVAGGTGTLTLRDSTLTANVQYGLAVIQGTGVELTNTTLTNNGQYAAWVEPNTRVTGLTGLTVSGNGGGTKDGAWYTGGTITGSETWRPGWVWFVGSGTDVGSATNTTASLRVEAGVTAKMASGVRLDVYGTLTTVGTPGAAVVFTSAQASPAPGNWQGIYLRSSASASRLSYAVVSYAGAGYGGAIVADGSSPTLDHATVTSSSSWGVLVKASGSPVIANSSFNANSSGGIGTETPGVPVAAQLNFWGSASGPSGTGSGSGQAASTGVAFEPWLLLPPSTAHYFSSASVLNRSFNPTLQIPHRVDFSTELEGTWTLTYFDGSAGVVRSFSGEGSPGVVSWDGTNQQGLPQPANIYRYEMQAAGPNGEPASPAQGYTVLDPGRQLAISGSAVSQTYFSPNGDGMKDSTAVSGQFNYDGVSWTVTVRNASNAAVRSHASVGSSFGFTWDGRDGAGSLSPDGLYSLVVDATAGTAFVTTTLASTLDNTPPAAAISSPAGGTVLSNVYQAGATDVPITGTAADTNLESWNLAYSIPAAPTTWTVLRTGTSSVTGGELFVWPTFPLANGGYTLRLSAFDRAGNSAAASTASSVANFKASHAPLQLNAGAGGTVAYTSEVPFPLTETLVIKNQSGAIVRTLFSGSRNAGSYADSWNGRSDAEAPLPDGPYFYVATVTAGANTLTWDLSGEYRNDYSDYLRDFVVQPYDPLNNRPLVVTYNFAQAGRISIAVSSLDVAHLPPTCGSPSFCAAVDRYEEAGAHTWTWAGVDDRGALLPGVRRLALFTERRLFAKNAVVVYGTKPTVSAVRVEPAVYGPQVGPQEISFDLATFQNQPAEVTIEFLNQSSLSTLRTIHLAAQQPGAVSTTWDGRADNGMWVALGYYTVTVRASDPIGNETKGQIQTTVRY